MLLTEYDDQKEAEIHDREISDAEEKGRMEGKAEERKENIAVMISLLESEGKSAEEARALIDKFFKAKKAEEEASTLHSDAAAVHGNKLENRDAVDRI